MDIKTLTEKARVIRKENDLYQFGVRLFDGNAQAIAGKVFEAVNGCSVAYASNILEACKMALQQAPIQLKESGDPHEEKV